MTEEERNREPKPELFQEVRAELEDRVSRSLATMSHSRTIPRRSSNDSLPLSFSQERMWFLDELAAGVPLYNICKVLKITGCLEAPALQQSLNTIVARHEALRTTFPSSNGIPRQLIHENRSIELPKFDLSSLAMADREAEFQRHVRLEMQRPFDLSTDLMLRATLIKLKDDEHVLLLVVHHIAFDGWSRSILLRELLALYEAFSGGRTSPLPDLPIQYADFALWQRQRLQGEAVENQLHYWKQQLGGDLPVLELPTDRPRPPIQTFRGARQSTTIPKGLLEELKGLSRHEGATLFMTLLAAFKTLLYRYTGQEDIIVGSPTAGRNRVEIEDLIGLFVNTSVLRTSPSSGLTFRQFIGQVRAVTLQALAYQELPFELLVANLNAERSLSSTPLFQVMFQLRNFPRQVMAMEGIEIQEIEVDSRTAQFDLALDMTETAHGLVCVFEYSTDLFEADTISRMQGHLRTMLEGIVACPDQLLSDLPLLTVTERHQILVEWNDTKRDYPRDSCIHELFEAVVERAPDAVAVRFREQQLTYGELNKQANQLAHHLRALGIGPELLVAVFVERSLEMIVALLGILKAGGAYVPMDPEYPAERLAFMIEDTKCAVVLTQKRLFSLLPEHKSKVICLDESWEDIARQPTENPAGGATAENLAYIIYTSGSTGKPKGVAIQHRGIVRLVINTNYIEVGPSDVVAQVANLCFDGSAFEIWEALLEGARLVLFTRDMILSPIDFASQLEQEGVSVLLLTPALLGLLARETPSVFKRLRYLLTGAEAAEPNSIREVLRNGPPQRLLNAYGPTETSVIASYYPIEDLAKETMNVPIGRPIANTQIFLLDRHLNPVPIGVHGEMYIGGPGVASGYLNRPDLTAELFVPNPFSTDPEERLYKTGDLARYLPDGNVEFLGRLDHQVKIRGFRIELGEIEAVLCQHHHVREAIVVAREDRPGDRRLVAYLVKKDSQSPTSNELRDFLQEKVPDYMVPSAFVFLDCFPLTPSRKVDRSALPALDHLPRNQSEDFVAPRDAVELELAKIWVSLLGDRQIGVKDSFFGLGGHSLLAVQLFSMIEESFGKRLPLSTLFEGATIGHLAEVLRREGRSGESWSGLVPIQPEGTKPPLFLANLLGDIPLGYRSLAAHLGPDQPIYSIQTQGLKGVSLLQTRIENLATYHVEIIQSLQPNGPYYLAGFSGAGVEAFEVARQLVAQGQEVALLALFDSGCPGFGEVVPAAQRIVLHLRKAARMGLKEGSPYVRERLIAIGQRFKIRIWQAAEKLDVDMHRSILDSQDGLGLLNALMLKHYLPKIYEGKITFFHSFEPPAFVRRDSKEHWKEFAAGGFDVHEVSGSHVTILAEPNVRILAEQLGRCLEKARTEASVDKY